MKKIKVLVILSGLFLFSSFRANNGGITTVTGVVLAEDGKPLPGALVYVTAGEEEALTKGKGEFSVETVKKVPFTVTAEHWQYKQGSVIVTDAGRKITLRLNRKK